MRKGDWMGKKKIQTEEERLIQKEKNMQYLKDFFGHVTSGNLFLLLSIGSLLSGIVINFLLSFYEDNGKYIQASYWLYLSFIILLVIGLFIKLTKTEVAI